MPRIPNHAAAAMSLVLSAGAASAQTTSYADVELPDGTIARRPVSNVVRRTNGVGDVYGERAVMAIDNLTGAFFNSTRSMLGTTHVVDDFSFAPGPWASATDRVALSWSWSFWTAEFYDFATSPSVNVRFRFYDSPGFSDAVGSNMIPPGTPLLAELVYGFPEGYFDTSAPGPGYNIFWYFPDCPFNTQPGDEELRFRGDRFLLEVSIEEPAEPHRLYWYPSAAATNPSGNAGLYIPATQDPRNLRQVFGIWFLNRPISPGSATSVFGRDMNGDGDFTASSPPIDGPTYSTPVELRDTRTSSGRSYAFSMKGFAAPPGCPCRADFDGSGGTPDTSDIDAFFHDWLAGSPNADADCSGGAPNSSDIEQFFFEWLRGGC